MRKQVKIVCCILCIMMIGMSCAMAADASQLDELWKQLGETNKSMQLVKQNGAQCELFYGGVFIGKANCVNGKLEGKQYFYQGGELRNVFNYANGEKDGVQLSYMGGPSSRRETTYAHGVLEGKTISYHITPDGEKHLYSEATYKNGLENGEERSYFQDGQIREQKNYKDGKLEGTSITYNYQGKKIRECTYKNGVLEGTTCKYDSNGVLSAKETYRDGVLISEVTVGKTTQYS